MWAYNTRGEIDGDVLRKIEVRWIKMNSNIRYCM